ncbi:MAG: RnfABCDGE type electron transport complex subunit D [Neomegalonema sp.]|nr:RnfABCDGE type electron transport complex subunit D [Neomegalonema sp.]
MQASVSKQERSAPTAPPWWAPIRLADPRLLQILFLSSLLTLGVLTLGFAVTPAHILISLSVALLVQTLATALLRWRGIALSFDPLSAIITALSLSLLLRTEAPWLSALGAAIAIGSKFALRWRGRHVFNPANLALVALPLISSGAWISPGQWGATGLLAVAVMGAGAMVANRAARLDTTLAFLSIWAGLTFARAAWLGDPIAIPLHQLQSGAVLVFAFFMISDPATTPPHRPARLLHAGAVAALGFWLQVNWLSNTGAIQALVILAPLTALLVSPLNKRQ